MRIENRSMRIEELSLEKRLIKGMCSELKGSRGMGGRVEMIRKGGLLTSGLRDLKEIDFSTGRISSEELTPVLLQGFTAEGSGDSHAGDHRSSH
jgi:hypothetical protein